MTEVKYNDFEDTNIDELTANISTDKLMEELNKNSNEAKELLEDEDKMEEFLQKLEKKLQVIPKVGSKLSYIPTLISLVRAYVKKEYPEIPLGTIISIVACLIYFLSPIDLIPDTIPVVGYLDDALVLGVVIKLVGNDIEEYIRWQEENGKREITG